MTWHSFSTSLAWHQEQILKCSGVLGTLHVYLPVLKQSQWFPRLAMACGPCNLLNNNCLWMMYSYVPWIHLCRAPLTFGLPTYIIQVISLIFDFPIYIVVSAWEHQVPRTWYALHDVLDVTVRYYGIDQGILSVEWAVKDIVYARLLFSLINRFALYGLTTMSLICSVLCQQWGTLLSDVSKVWWYGMWLNQTCINFCSVPIACFVVVSFRGAIFWRGGGLVYCLKK